MLVQPYLFFEGRCEEALEFYTKALDAKVEMKMRYGDNPEGCPKGMPAGTEKKIMHSAFMVGESMVMASDGMNTGKPDFKGVTLSITMDDEAGVKRVFDALSAGGKVVQPLAKTFFSPSFGMLADKFGVSWMVLAYQKM